MEHHHSDYRDWRLCVTLSGPLDAPRFIGHGVCATLPHDVIMVEASTEPAALDELHRQVDAIEDAASGSPADQPGVEVPGVEVRLDFQGGGDRVT
jgi:hypothetical protein